MPYKIKFFHYGLHLWDFNTRTPSIPFLSPSKGFDSFVGSGGTKKIQQKYSETFLFFEKHVKIAILPVLNEKKIFFR